MAKGFDLIKKNLDRLNARDPGAYEIGLSIPQAADELSVEHISEIFTTVYNILDQDLQKTIVVLSTMYNMSCILGALSAPEIIENLTATTSIASNITSGYKRK